MKIQSILPRVVVGSDDVSKIGTLLSCNFYHIKEEYLKNNRFDRKAYKKLNEAIIITEYINAINLVSSYSTFGKNVIDFPIKLNDDERLSFVEYIYKVYGLDLIFLDVLITRDLIKHLEKQNINLVREYCEKYRFFINSEWYDEHNRLYNKIDKSWGLLDYLLTDHIKNINSETVKFYDDVINVIFTSNNLLGDISRLLEYTIDFHNLNNVMRFSLRVVDTNDVFKIINYIVDNYIFNRHKDDTVYIQAQSIVNCILFSILKDAKTKDDIKVIFDKYDDYFSLLAKEDNNNFLKYDYYLKLYILAIKSFVYDDIESILQYKDQIYEISKKFFNFGMNTFHIIYIFYICKEYTDLIKDNTYITAQNKYTDEVDTFLEKSYKQIYKKCILKGYLK